MLMRTAKARVKAKSVSPEYWLDIRSKARGGSLLKSASAKVVLDSYDPEKYLLTHCTIVASVDTEETGLPTGKFMSNGVQIERLYSDFYVTPSTRKYINNNCFTPGTAITMHDGTVKSIEDVKENDLVRTHLGRVRRVTQTFQTEVSSPILEIKPRGTTERLYVTEEHPFFVFRPPTECVHCGAPISRKLRAISHLLGRHYCSKACFFKKKVKNSCLLKGKAGEFVAAGSLNKTDFTATPVVQETVPTGLTPGQARLIGLFAAEGYYNLRRMKDGSWGRVGVCWAYHEDERDTLAKKTVDLLYAEFGVVGVIIDHAGDRGIHVTTNLNYGLVDFFQKWVQGEGSTTKTLAAELLEAERVVQLELVRGWFEGDGCYQVTDHDSRITGVTSSKSMANQMQIILHRLKVSSHLTYSKSSGRKRIVCDDGTVQVIPDLSKECHSWAVACGSGWVEELVQDTVYAHLYDSKVQAVPKLRYLNGYHLQIIESIRSVPYTGTVYNFDVEEDHSYIANGVAVHNCDAFERKLLLSTYRTFIGAQNYCFVPGTMIVMADGTQKPIELVEEGDSVLTHLGRPRKVLRTFERQVDEDICDVYVDRFKSPISCTKEHPFRALNVNCPDPSRYTKGSEASAARYKRDNIRKYLRDGDGWLQGKVSTEETWVEAGSLKPYNFLLGPAESLQKGGSVSEGVLLGYYLAEGTLLKKKGDSFCGVKLSFGTHEVGLIAHSQELAKQVFGDSTRVSVGSGLGVTHVSIYGSDVGTWFHTHGGEYSHLKRISPEVMGWSREALLGLLAGYTSGDGSLHKRTKRVVTSSTSENLSSQVLRICDIVGVKATLWRESHEGFERRRQHTSSVSMVVKGQPKVFEVKAKYPIFNVIISKDSVSLFAGLTPRWLPSDLSSGARKRQDFSWYRGHHVHSVRSVESRRYTGPVYNFEVEGDNSYVLGLTGVAVHNCEHVQIPELSKGRVIDAAARDIGESIYIDILVATERKHVELVRDISSGAMSTLSMGAQISFSICTFCGNVAQDEVQLCPHVKYAKGTKFVDASGQERVIAELCGHWTVPESVKFIEASWVGVPAFTGAVVRGVLEPGAAVAEAIKGKLVDSFQSSRVEDLSKARTLAASLKTAQFGQEQTQEQAPPQEEAPSSDSLEGPSNDLYKALVDSVKTKVEEELAKRDQRKTEDIMDPNASNESLVKSALVHPKWQRRAKALLQKSSLDKVKKVLAGLYLYEVAGMDAVAKRRIYTGAELLGLVRMRDFFERKASYAGEQRITSTVIAVGSLRKFPNQESYFTACASHMGRNPNNIERMHLLEKARIFSLGID